MNHENIEKNSKNKLSPRKVLAAGAIALGVGFPIAHAATGETPAIRQEHAQESLEFMGLEALAAAGAVAAVKTKTAVEASNRINSVK
jgi:hypothetical protein